VLAKDVLREMVVDGRSPDHGLLDAYASIARNTALDPAFRALVLALPGQEEMASHLHSHGHVPDPMAIYDAKETLAHSVAEHLQDIWAKLYSEMNVEGPYSPTAEPAGKRALQGRALAYLSRLDGGLAAQKQFASANNMTQQLAAFAALLNAGHAETAVDAFYEQWKHERLVIDKWFAMQVSHAAPSQAVDVARQLTRHPDFDLKNPNRFRSVFGALMMNPAGFHAADGSGYQFFADWLIKLDPLNPMTAARMSSGFETWKRYDQNRQDLIAAELDRVLRQPNLSRDMSEMITRIRAA
jgi:aminopeptidase N